MTRARWLGWMACVGLLAGCGASGSSSLEGAWVGVLHTTAGACPDQRPSDLVVSNGEVTFVPGDGVLALRGRRGADPDAVHAQLLATDANHKPLPMVLDARLTEGQVVGTYGTPTCRADVLLHRPADTGLNRVLGH